MRHITELINQFPNKTGKELLEIQAQDKLDDEKEFKRLNKKKLSIIKDITDNGRYFKGAFGMEQYYMYKITKIELVGETLYCDYEQIVLFDSQNIKKGILGENRLNFELKTNSLIEYERNFSFCDRATETEYNELKNYLLGVVPKFFKKDFEKHQKEFGKN